MQSVRKVVIPAAGKGTRFLPITKVIPKEMIPIINKPVIQYGLEEAVASGIRQAVIVTSHNKQVMENYFVNEPPISLVDQEAESASMGYMHLKHEYMDKRLNSLLDSIKISYVRQAKQLGLGHAISTASTSIGKEPFAVVLPDDIIQSAKPVLQKMMEIFQRKKASILAVQKVPRQLISSYGIIDAQQVEPRLYKVNGLVEKPKPEEAPSNLGIVGRYILTPNLFDALESTNPGMLGEIQLTDGIANLLENEAVYAYEFHGQRYDVGTPLGLIEASINIAMSNPSLRNSIKAILAKTDKPSIDDLN